MITNSRLEIESNIEAHFDSEGTIYLKGGSGTEAALLETIREAVEGNDREEYGMDEDWCELERALERQDIVILDASAYEDKYSEDKKI